MKNLIQKSLTLLAIAFCTTGIPCDANLNNVNPNLFSRNYHHSKSSMYSRQLIETTFIQRSGWHALAYQENPPAKNAIQTYFSSFSTTKGQFKQAHYFLPTRCEKNTILVAGDNAPANFPSAVERDIRAEWLGIDNPQFQGSFSIDPQQQQWGITLEWKQSLETIIDHPLAQGYWISVSLPLVFAKNNLHLKQASIFGKGSLAGPQDIIQAFTQTKWNYARISPHARSIFGLAEINVKLGQAYLANRHFELIYYSCLRIPTSHGQDPRYLFSPFIGNNLHLGFGGGVDFQLPLTEDGSPYATTFFLTLEAIFLLDHKDWRTFDLKHKPWSRYLLFNIQNGPPDQNIPGVNVLTLCTRIRPYGHVEMNLGLRVTGRTFEAEIGYGIWGHAEEVLEPRCHDFPVCFGIAGSGPNSQGLATSASASTIRKQAANDVDSQGNPQFVPLLLSDIDLHSAAAQSVINHQIHGCISYLRSSTTVDGAITVGTFCEYPQRNAALQTWGAWFKIALAV